MSATQAGAVTAVALQLLRALDSYAEEAGQFTHGRVHTEAYHRMRVQLDGLRRCVQDVPGLELAWVELLIRHFELAHVRWKVEQGQADAGSLEPVAAEHAAAVQRLRVLCSLMIQRDSCATG
jgi:hypothetical protein